MFAPVREGPVSSLRLARIDSLTFCDTLGHLARQRHGVPLQQTAWQIGDVILPQSDCALRNGLGEALPWLNVRSCANFFTLCAR